MNARKSLADKGYDPQTADRGMGWLCTIEVNRQVRTFQASTEEAAIDRAAEYVEGMEERYREQQERLRCEGCGE